MDASVIFIVVLVAIIGFSGVLAFKKEIDKDTERFWLTNIIAFEIFLLVGIFSILNQTPNNLILEKVIFGIGIFITGGTLLTFALKSGTRFSTFFFWFLTLFLLEYLIIIATVFLSI